MPFSEEMAAADDGIFAEFGELCQYLPGQGAGEAVDIKAILLSPEIEEASSPGYFADIGVRPTEIAVFERKDEVIWADGGRYVVNRVVRKDDIIRLVLHQKASE